MHREEFEDDNDEGDDDRDDDDGDDEDKEHPRATYYVYDNEDIIMEYNHKGKVTARYVHGLGIDEPLAIERKGDIYYYHTDGLGSITALTDAKGKVVQRYEYDSFGKIKRQGNKVKNSYTYTAREYDRETGLYYYRARYYDAKVGRFISKDPFPGYLDNPQTLNSYQYTLNAPINWIDPYGYLTWGERVRSDVNSGHQLIMQPVVFDNIVSHTALVINTPISPVSSGDYKRFLCIP